MQLHLRKGRSSWTGNNALPVDSMTRSFMEVNILQLNMSVPPPYCFMGRPFRRLNLTSACMVSLILIKHDVTDEWPPVPRLIYAQPHFKTLEELRLTSTYDFQLSVFPSGNVCSQRLKGLNALLLSQELARCRVGGFLLATVAARLCFQTAMNINARNSSA